MLDTRKKEKMSIANLYIGLHCYCPSNKMLPSKLGFWAINSFLKCFLSLPPVMWQVINEQLNNAVIRLIAMAAGMWRIFLFVPN